jgi:NADH-quinone oxidoreductase subunit L
MLQSVPTGLLNVTPEILFLPLVGFVALGLLGRWLPRWLIALVGCGTVASAFALAVASFFQLQDSHVPTSANLWDWVTSGHLTISFGLQYDQLTAVMLLVVTGVGFLIHVYSVGYMEDDPGFWRYFAFLNLFIFTMVLLVTADNFLFLLVGWAGVGLASFLLIGFWYTRPAAVAAAKKAFVVNVIGDFGLMIAIFLIVKTFGTLNFGELFVPPAAIYHDGFVGRPVMQSQLIMAHFAPNSPELIAITLLLFVAAAAKSAQFPLHVWLPDAMEGPTPVSALIHAATMVTAGVYLVARTAPLYNRAPTSLVVVAGIGGFTALFAATIACVQTDIKRVLAYSTISQLGYMFMGEGAGGFSAGIFHLTTHAYFKALLFMGAGAVIHALGGEQDMRRMGGLRSKLPRTFWMMLAGALALAAIIPFAGFWSKDAVLGAIWQRATTSPDGGAGWYALYAAGVLTAALTGFYIIRLICVTFLGAYRGGPVAAGHGAHAGERGAPDERAGGQLVGLHAIGWTMGAPMAVLALLALAGGFVGLPGRDALGDFLAPALGQPFGLPAGSAQFYLSAALGLAAAALGIGLAWARYGTGKATLGTSRNPLYQLVAHKYFVDEIYAALFVRPIMGIGRLADLVLEGGLLDGGARGLGWLTARTSGGLRRLQTGYVRNYALALTLGAIVLLLFYIVHL